MSNFTLASKRLIAMLSLVFFDAALFCYDDPCRNGATCDEVRDECDCDGDWEGEFCDGACMTSLRIFASFIIT